MEHRIAASNTVEDTLAYSNSDPASRPSPDALETEQSWSWLRQLRQQRIPDEAHATTNSSSSHWLHALSSSGGVQHERLGVYMEEDHRYGQTEDFEGEGSEI